MSRSTSYGSPSLTVAALAYREGEHLRRCFQSLRPLLAATDASTLILLDAEADARTSQIAHEVAQRVARHPFDNFSAQRNRALDLAMTEWVFFIDPDERMTPALAAEIAASLPNSAHAAYRVPRRNVLFGHEVRHTGWYPDYQVRLLARDSCRYDETQEVHEVPRVNGTIGTLGQPLIHYNYRSWRQFARKQLAYAPLEAKALHAADFRARPWSFVGQPLRELKRRLFDYQGYKDGLIGFELSLAMAAYRLLVYWHIWQLQKQQPR